MLGESPFLGQDICTKVTFTKGHLWRVDFSVEKDWLKKGKCHFLDWVEVLSWKGLSGSSEERRLHDTG